MSESAGPISQVTLRALEGTPLMHEAVRRMVVAAAEALAEREGVGLVDIFADDSSVTFQIRADRLVAVAFAAELRRLTTTWYTRKFGVSTLWGEPTQGPNGP